MLVNSILKLPLSFEVSMITRPFGPCGSSSSFTKIVATSTLAPLFSITSAGFFRFAYTSRIICGVLSFKSLT